METEGQVVGKPWIDGFVVGDVDVGISFDNDMHYSINNTLW